MKKIVVIVCLAVVFGACTKKEAEQKGSFLAKVGNSVITQDDFEKELLALPNDAQRLFQTKEGREKVLENVKSPIGELKILVFPIVAKPLSSTRK